MSASHSPGLDAGAAADLDQAIRLLEELNALVDDSGTPYRSTVRYHGYEPWWFHQQTALDAYLVPFVRYLPLLTRSHEAARAVLVDCPDEMRRILPLIPTHNRVELRGSRTRPRRLRRLRRAASVTFYRTTTAIAMAHAIVRHPEALVYSVDSVDGQGRNRWIDGLYQALGRRGTRFLEIAWSESGVRALRQWRMRPRLVTYVQALTPQGHAYPRPRGALGGFLASLAPRRRNSLPAGDAALDRERVRQFLHNLARNVLVPAARRSIRSIRRYESLLRLTRPAGVYLMDDYVHAFELVVACRRRGVPTVAVQHGQFNRYTAGLMGYGFDGVMHQSYDRYCVWNDFFAQLLVRHSRLVPPDSVVVAGTPRAGTGAAPERAAQRAAELGRARDASSTQTIALRPGVIDGPASKDRSPTVCGRTPPDAGAGRTRVLWLEERYDALAQQEVQAYIRALDDAAGIDLWMKVHPSTAQGPGRATATTGRGPLRVDAPLDELLARVDVVVASVSSAIFEAILHEKPVVLVSTSRYRDPHGLADARLAGYAASAEEIVRSVRAAAGLPRSELIRRRDCVWGARSNDGGETAVLEMDKLPHPTR